MSRLILAALIIMFPLIYGCDSPEREYRDFISEMDILTRLDLCFKDALLEKTDLYTEIELNYIKADLAGAVIKAAKAGEVTALFSQTADMLLQYIDFYGKKDFGCADMALKDARAKYIEAKNALYNIVPEEKNV